MDDARARFAANLREARKNAGMTQEALGEASGLHPTEISRLEGAGRDPRLGTIVRLAAALKTTSAELLAGV
jgi:transcriptional regulator with XRE-family HTH domain